MAEGKFVCYLRVSTDKQGASGLGIEAQREAVTQYLNGGKWVLVHEFIEIESGKNSDRPELLKALALCKKSKATLLVAKLDRLSRSVSFLSRLMEAGVEFVACDNPHANKLMIHLLAAFAEHERDMISARTKAALAAAKARGATLGTPRNLDDTARAAGREARTGKATAHASSLQPVIETIKAAGHTSARAIAAELTRRGVPTPKGSGDWQATQVTRVLARLE